MGLDMYLNAHRYVSKYSDECFYTEMNDLCGLPNFRAKGITYEAIYWRKANAIHQWFVNNVQKGVDDCSEFVVKREALKLLMDVCAKVNEDNQCAHLYLPVQDGFYFGSQDYDADYFDELHRTEHMLNLVLNEMDEDSYSFTYRASW